MMALDDMGLTSAKAEVLRLRAELKRYSDFVHKLAGRDHYRSCPANEHCTCIVGEAADVVMGGIKR
jgi:hypothetical protein